MKSYVDKPEALLEYVVSEPMLKAGALDAMRQDEKDFTYRVVPPESVMATRGGVYLEVISPDGGVMRQKFTADAESFVEEFCSTEELRGAEQARKPGKLVVTEVQSDKVKASAEALPQTFRLKPNVRAVIIRSKGETNLEFMTKRNHEETMEEALENFLLLRYFETVGINSVSRLKEALAGDAVSKIWSFAFLL